MDIIFRLHEFLSGAIKSRVHDLSEWHDNSVSFKCLRLYSVSGDMAGLTQ